MEVEKTYLVYYRTWSAIPMYLLENGQYILMIPESMFTPRHIQVISEQEATELLDQTLERIEEGNSF